MECVINSSPTTLKCLELCNNHNFDAELISDFHSFVEFCENLSPSKKTHYHKLDEWLDSIYHFLDNMLEKNGFINGNARINCTKPNVMFWWRIYDIDSLSVYSPNLNTEVAIHHSSAYERNEALKIELNVINECLSKNTSNKEQT